MNLETSPLTEQKASGIVRSHSDFDLKRSQPIPIRARGTSEASVFFPEEKEVSQTPPEQRTAIDFLARSQSRRSSSANSQTRKARRSSERRRHPQKSKKNSYAERKRRTKKRNMDRRAKELRLFDPQEVISDRSSPYADSPTVGLADSSSADEFRPIDYAPADDFNQIVEAKLLESKEDALKRLCLEKMELKVIHEAWLGPDEDYPEWPACVETVALYCNELNTLPNSLTQLTKIVSLGLNENDFTNFPLVITQLRTLQDLDLCKNKIQTIPEEISNLESLETLNLGRNSLSEIPEAIFHLPNLRQLFLSNNKITSTCTDKVRVLADVIHNYEHSETAQ